MKSSAYQHAFTIYLSLKIEEKMEKWVEMMEKETEQEANWQDIYSWTTRSHHEEELKLCVHCFLKTLRFQLP